MRGPLRLSGCDEFIDGAEPAGEAQSKAHEEEEGCCLQPDIQPVAKACGNEQAGEQIDADLCPFEGALGFTFLWLRHRKRFEGWV